MEESFVMNGGRSFFFSFWRELLSLVYVRGIGGAVCWKPVMIPVCDKKAIFMLYEYSMG
jgi:hypothetical protein